MPEAARRWQKERAIDFAFLQYIDEGQAGRSASNMKKVPVNAADVRIGRE